MKTMMFAQQKRRAAAFASTFAVLLGTGCSSVPVTQGSVSSSPPVGARAPAPATVIGIDLSRHQKSVEFNHVRKAGIRYVFVRATNGRMPDQKYAEYSRAARCAGLVVGSYHYYRTGESANEQFDHFSKVATVLSGDLPPVVDIEALDKNSEFALATELRRFLDQLEQRYRVKPIIYSNRDFANVYLKGLSVYPLWLAEYTAHPKPKLPLDWATWTFWQHKQDPVAGIPGDVDYNRFNGDLDRMKHLLVEGDLAAQGEGAAGAGCSSA